MANPTVFIERATSEKLVAPDWAVNLEICDIINMNPRQAKDAMKALKKRLRSKNPKIQLLALFVLEALSKNCGDDVHLQTIECNILNELVKIVKKKPDLNVREKILILIDMWQEAFGGPRGKYPQYYAAYNELKSAGVEFPPREENAVPLFTPPQTQPIMLNSDLSTYDDAAVIEASLQSDASDLSLSEIRNARGIANVLSEMLSALDPHSPEGVKQEVIVDLVEQCQSYQKRVMLLVNSTTDEELLCHGLTLNDDLQRVLCQYDDIVTGTPVGPRATETAVADFVNVNHEDDESEDDLSQLAHRSSRDNMQGQGRKVADASHEQMYVSSFMPPPPPPPSKKASVGAVDYLSGDMYQSKRQPVVPKKTPVAAPLDLNTQNGTTSTPSFSLSSPPHVNDSIPSPIFARKPNHIEAFQGIKSNEQVPSAPLESQTPVFLPPPPSKYNQRQQFFEQHQHAFSNGASHANGSGSSYDGLVGQTQNLSLQQDDHPTLGMSKSSPPGRPSKQDALFKDLVDFAKVKSSSSSKPTSRRTYY